jgi:hypothetical protein
MNLKLYFVFLALAVYALTGTAQINNFSSKLPLVYINTSGEEIRDEPKIQAEMGIIWNEAGGLNKTSSEFNHFQGNIGIEIRGSSSQMFPKKSYGFELHDENGEDMDFPLLGMPEEEDWILYAPYSDKSLIRNVLTFSLAERLGAYSPRCRLVELFINNKYEGIYVLMEKIKRDKNRVDIAKLKPEDLTGEELTGGYIVKIDKTTGSGGSGWQSDYVNKMQRRTFYQYEYPAADEIHQTQANYIRNYISDFEEAVYNHEFDLETGYQQYIDINSFIDYMIINELSKNIDGYRLSTFMYKDKNEKLNIGPVWDFNLAYGNANYGNAWETFGLEIYVDLGDDQWQNPFWWSIFMGDRNFTKALRCRWDDVYFDVLATDQVINTIDSLVVMLDEPSERNFARWPVLGEWIWPNYYVAPDYSSEITWLKNWIYERMRYLNLSIPGDCDSDPTEPLDFALSTFPNPFTNKLTIQVISDKNLSLGIQLYSVNGNKVHEQYTQVSEGLTTIEINTTSLQRGLYIYRVLKGEVEVEVGKVVKM